MTEQTSGFDLGAADISTATRRVDVHYDPKGDPSGFIVLSKDSDAYRDEAKRQRAAGYKRGAVKQSRIDTKTDKGAAELDDIIVQNEIDIACAVIVGWYGFVRDKQPVPFDAGVTRGLMVQRKTWRDKVLAALEEEDSFLPSSQPT